MIVLDNVSFEYEKRIVLNQISLTIPKGDFVAVVGPNGAGKSTLAKLMMGLNKPLKGTVTIDGINTKRAKSCILAKHIGYLFQNPDRQICKATIAEEIRFGLSCVLTDKKEIEERLQKTLKNYKFDGTQNPFSLSRGQRQQLALACILSIQPDILILDEPTTGLDYRECIRIMHQIQKMNASGTTIVMICHDMELVLDFAKRVIVLADGKIQKDDTPYDVFLDSDLLKRTSLLPPQILDITTQLLNCHLDFTTSTSPEDLALSIVHYCSRQTIVS